MSLSGCATTLLIGYLFGVLAPSSLWRSVSRSSGQDSLGPLVRVNVSVWDADGKPVTDLSPQDFTILEQGQPQKITRFIKSTAPLQVMILVDTSGSMTRVFPRLQAGLLHFVSSFGLYDEIAVVSFTRAPRLETDFSVNVERVKKALQGLQVTRERTETTQLYDALEPALSHLEGFGTNVRTALVLVTDGIDRGSRQFTEKTSLQLASQRFVTFYVIQAQGRDHQYLKNLAEVTAGRFYLADKFLEKNLEELARHLHSHYVLGYVSSNPPPEKKMFTLQVTVTRPGVKLIAPEHYRVAPGR